MDKFMANNNNTIGEHTSIRVGLLLTVIGIFGSSIWWASSISTKIDVVITNQKNIGDISVQQTVDIRKVENRLAVVELSGSPAVVARLMVLESEISKLKEQRQNQQILQNQQGVQLNQQQLQQHTKN